MMTKTLIVTLSLFLSFFSYGQNKKFGAVKKTDKHELISSSGIYMIAPAGSKKGTSFIGYRSETGELIYTPISEKAYSELQSGIPSEWKTKKRKPMVSKTGEEYSYYKTQDKSNKPQGVLLIAHKGNYSRITLGAVDAKYFAIREEDIYSISFD